ncbi:MAG: hypothetical protein ACWGOX_11835 [Desulforhopalus sp.]
MNEKRAASGAKATAYICAGFTCKTPVTEPADLVNQLNALKHNTQTR